MASANGGPITGFEGVEDTLLYETLQQAERKKQQIMEMQLPGQERAAAALGNFADVLVQKWAPPEAARRAAAVTEARTNAAAAVRGQTFDSPHARRIALVEAAATDLESKGLTGEADRLRANADAIREQALELSILQGKDKEQTARAEYEAATLQDRIKEAADKARREAAERAVAEGTILSRVAKSETDAQAAAVGLERDKFARDNTDPLSVENIRAQIDSSRASAAASRQTALFNSWGEPTTVTINATGAVVSALARPDGNFVVTQPDGSSKLYSGSEVAKASLQGAPSDFNNTAKNAAATRLQGTFGLVNLATVMRRSIISDPSAGTLGGDAAQLMQNVKADARAALSLVGGPKLLSDNDKRIESTLNTLGITNAVARARASELAYAIATAREGGRLSDADVRAAAIASGSSNSDPRQRMAVLDSLLIQTATNTTFAADQIGVARPKAYNDAIRIYSEEMRAHPVQVPGYGPPSRPTGMRGEQPARRPTPRGAPPAARRVDGGVFVPSGGN